MDYSILFGTPIDQQQPETIRTELWKRGNSGQQNQADSYTTHLGFFINMSAYRGLVACSYPLEDRAVRPRILKLPLGLKLILSPGGHSYLQRLFNFALDQDRLF